jgi:hypothetical protein
MLTAHALTPESLKKSIRLGAISFLPKEKMSDLVKYLEDVVLSISRSVGLLIEKSLFETHLRPLIFLLIQRTLFII